MTWPALDTPADDARSRWDGVDPVAESFQIWMQACGGSGWVAATGAELVEVAASGGRVTVDPVRAVWSVPSYRAAAMDGIAVRAASTAIATPQRPARLLSGEFDVVDTGDLMPDGCDAVIMREHVRHVDDGGVEIDNPVLPGRHVRAIGEDIQAGRMVLPGGHRIRPVDLAAVAAAGHREVLVRRRPVVAILATGDEVRPVGTVLAPGEVLDTNSLMLAGMAEEAGGEVWRLPIVADGPDVLAQVVVAAAQDADVVLVIAGSSAGRGDHTAAVVRRIGRVGVHGLAMRPGHPVLLGVVSGQRPVPVVGVPGYPASAERAFTCFVLPLLRRMLGTGALGVARSAGDDGAPAKLACPVASAGHLDEYLRMRLARVIDPRTGQEALVAVPLQRGAGALNAIVQTEAILRIPVGTTGFPAGAQVRPVPVAGAGFVAATTIVSGRALAGHRGAAGIAPGPAALRVAALHPGQRPRRQRGAGHRLVPCGRAGAAPRRRRWASRSRRGTRQAHRCTRGHRDRPNRHDSRTARDAGSGHRHRTHRSAARGTALPSLPTQHAQI